MLSISNIARAVRQCTPCTTPVLTRCPSTLTIDRFMPQKSCITQVRHTSSALRSSRVALRKRFGQHLLKNADVVANIVACAKLKPEDRVFEVGPGTGNLTVHLLEQAAMVYAVELDTRMAEAVTSRVSKLGLSHKFRCVNADVLKVKLPVFDAMVANIPYQISSPLLTRIFEHTPRPRVAIIMFQKEFAQRMVARPGSSLYCRLSVNSQLLSSSVKIVINIDRKQFRPPPKVDSAVVEIIPRDPPTDLNFIQWDYFLRIAFAGKNKTLRAVFVNKNILVTLVKLRGDTKYAARDVDAAGEAVDTAIEVGEAASATEKQNEAASATVKTASGVMGRQEFSAAKQAISAVLESTGLHDHRANAMSIPEFMKVYKALEADGWRFRQDGINEESDLWSNEESADAQLATAAPGTAAAAAGTMLQ